MSSSAPNQIIEHVVLLKVKPSADPSAVNDMVRNLNDLATLDYVFHISVGPVTRCCFVSLTFTHLLHARYRSKSDLAFYTVEPTHVNVVVNYVKPVVDDVMAVDWVAEDFSGPVVVPSGAALRLTVMKLKEEAGESGKSEVLGIVRGIQEKFDSIKQLTTGENFSPKRSKGFSIVSIVVVKGAEELDALATESELVNEQKNNAREFLRRRRRSAPVTPEKMEETTFIGRLVRGFSCTFFSGVQGGQRALTEYGERVNVLGGRVQGPICTFAL